MNKLKILTDDASNRQFQLLLSEVDLGLLMDLFCSVTDHRAASLRDLFENTIRSNAVFALTIFKKIIACPDCNGTGNIKTFDDFREAYNLKSCPRCKKSGLLVRFTSIRYEPLNDQYRMNMAPEY